METKAQKGKGSKGAARKPVKSLPARIESLLLSRGAFYNVIYWFILHNLLQFWWGAIEEAVHLMESDEDFGPEVVYTIPIARGFGYTMNLNVGLILVFGSRALMTALRKTPLNIVFPFDKAMPLFHMAVGYVVFVAALLHGVFHLAGGLTVPLWGPGFGGWTFCVITGFVIFGIFTLMVLTAQKKIRTNKFELFYYTHLLGAFLFIVLLFLHGNFREVLYTYKWITPPVFLYVLDRIIRKLAEHQGRVSISSTSAPDCGGNIFRLAVPKSFNYKPGQYAEIKVPSISRNQWHPITIASAPHEEEMVFFIKVAGDWTRKLQALIKEMTRQSEESLGKGNSTGEEFKIHVRGPYGAPSEHVGQYGSVVLISGGVGSTPFCSIAKDAVHRVEARELAKGSIEDDDESSGNILRLERSITMTKADMGDAGRTFLKRRKTFGEGTEDEDENETEFGRSTVPFTSIGDRLRAVLHSATLQTLLLWNFLARLYIIMAAGALLHVRLVNSPGFRTADTGFMVADLILSIFFVIPLIASVLVDYPKMRKSNLLDIFVLIPVSILPVIFHSLGLAGVGTENPSTEAWPYVFYFFVIPVTGILYGWRYIRIVGEASLIAPSAGYKHVETRSLDFIWTTPKKSDDEWLVGELEPHAFSKYLRLHRFITREKGDVEEGNVGMGRFSNNYGRPDWDETFETLILNSRSNTTVGIFFCGPPKMEDAVRIAAMDAMARSTQRGILYRPLGRCARTKRGCNVRFVFRAENF